MSLPCVAPHSVPCGLPVISCMFKCWPFHVLYEPLGLEFGSHLRSRATSGRSAITPLGHCGFSFVSKGNLLLARVVLLLMVASFKKARWLLEQPQGSTMPEHPRWSWFVDRVPVSWKH